MQSTWVGELLDLRNRNDRRVIFAVDSDIVEDDRYQFWYAENARVYLDKILDGACETHIDIELDEVTQYSKSFDDDEVFSLLTEAYPNATNEELDFMFELLPWEEVIIVRVSA